eukprot:PhF_6_TR22204/c0_g1_i2/m.31340
MKRSNSKSKTTTSTTANTTGSSATPTRKKEKEETNSTTSSDAITNSSTSKKSTTTTTTTTMTTTTKRSNSKPKLTKKTLQKYERYDSSNQEVDIGQVDKEGDRADSPSRFSEKDLATMLQMRDPELEPRQNLSNNTFMKELKEYENSISGWRKEKKDTAPRRLTMTLVMKHCLDPSIQELGQDAMVKGVLELQILRMDKMRLTAIDDLECLTDLRQVYLQHNFIRKMEGFEFMLSLTTLNLSHNNIAAIDGIYDLPIESLDLSFNEIQGCDVSRDLPYKTLRYFNLQGNPCGGKCDSEILSWCTNLVEFNGNQRVITVDVEPTTTTTASQPTKKVVVPVVEKVEEVEEDSEEVGGGGDVVHTLDTFEIAPDVRTTGRSMRESLISQVEVGLQRRHQMYEDMLRDPDDVKSVKPGAEEDLETQLEQPVDRDTVLASQQSLRNRDDLRVAGLHQANVARMGLEDKWSDVQLRCRTRMMEISQRNALRRMEAATAELNEERERG